MVGDAKRRGADKRESMKERVIRRTRKIAAGLSIHVAGEAIAMIAAQVIAAEVARDATDRTLAAAKEIADSA